MIHTANFKHSIVYIETIFSTELYQTNIPFKRVYQTTSKLIENPSNSKKPLLYNFYSELEVILPIEID